MLLEDVAALTGLVFAFIGVGLTAITGNGVWDAIGTLAIGLLLILVAVVLGIETKSLLVGEGANLADAAAIEDAILAGDETDRIIHMKTMYLGPDEILVGAKIAVDAELRFAEVAAGIDAIEKRIREAVPAARTVYLEPDVYRPNADPAPPTDAIVIKGLE